MNLIEILAAGGARPGGVAFRALCVGLLLAAPAAAGADEGADAPAPGGGAGRTPRPLPPEVADSSRWSLGAQLTATGLLVPGFSSPYRNADLSFGAGSPTRGWSAVATVFGGVRLWEGAIAVAQPEWADGRGAPNVSGIAGYADGNIIRVSKVGNDPYFARLYVQQDIALGAAEASEAGAPEDRFMPASPLALRRARPASRVEITAGKFATPDFFDAATAASDPRHRFMNWSLMTNGAWDYAADTRGYTWGLAVALEQPRWALRAAVAMMPTEANGPVLDGDLRHARSETIEGEWRYDLGGNAGAVKLLGYANHARMGSFGDALAAAAPGGPPSVDAVVRRGAVKYGAGVLLDQRVGPAAAFVRVSWNDGRTEEFAFTQIDRAASAGVDLPTDGWGRAGDHVGVGVAVNGLSGVHARYYAAGGADFQLGDGGLRYRPEAILEVFYALHLGGAATLTADLQGIANPGMNADRGPALVAGLRLHAHM